jgi:PAS domain-containing protein
MYMRQRDLRGVSTSLPRPTEVLHDRTEDAGGPLLNLVDQIPALFWTTDTSLVITSSFGSGRLGLGLGHNQLVGTTVSQLVEAGDGRDEPFRAHERALAGESVAFDIRWAERAFRASVGPLRDSTGHIIGTICVAL